MGRDLRMAGGSFLLGEDTLSMEACELNRQVICPLPNFFKDFIYVILERGEGREKEGEKHQRVVASRAPPTGDLACTPGMWPDWELNQPPFGSQAGAQSTEPHQPGPNFYTWKRHSTCSQHPHRCREGR